MSKTSKQGTEQFVSLVRNTCFKQNDDPLEGFSLPWSIILWNKFQFMYNKRFCWWSELGENKIWEKQFSHCTLRWTHLVFSQLTNPYKDEISLMIWAPLALRQEGCFLIRENNLELDKIAFNSGCILTKLCSLHNL